MLNLVPVTSLSRPAPLAKPDLSPAILIQRLQPSRTISTWLNGEDRMIWYFEKPAASRRDNRDCAYISHVRNSKTFTMAYHPLDRNDQVVKDLPMDQLAAAVEDLLAAGFGPQPVKQSHSHGSVAQVSQSFPLLTERLRLDTPPEPPFHAPVI